MRRCLVLGSGGAGKTTFALAFGEVTGLPVVHLDRHYWQPGWRAPPTPEWEATVRGLLARPSLADGCGERLTFEFLHWIWTYPGRRRPEILARLERVGPGVAVHVLNGRGAQRSFLDELAGKIRG
ncbi:MAG TPA: hypothetical protein VK858_06665 [Longimicrobiales bacterium]|nr:hypothetical protein [Longimicrobiales bacterium]